MYKIITPYFTDLKDNNRKYKYGDIYPVAGVKVSKERLEELASQNNKAKTVIIEKIKEVEKINDGTQQVLNDEKINTKKAQSQVNETN